MGAFSKRDRDTAMRIICEFHAKREPGHSIGPEYLHYHGLPKRVDADQIVKVLASMGYLTIKRDLSGEYSAILLTDSGRCYFERKADISHEKRIEWIRYAITTAVAVIALIKSFLPEISAILAQI